MNHIVNALNQTHQVEAVYGPFGNHEEACDFACHLNATYEMHSIELEAEVAELLEPTLDVEVKEEEEMATFYNVTL